MEFRQVIYASLTTLLKHCAGPPCIAEERSLEESLWFWQGFLTLLALPQTWILIPVRVQLAQWQELRRYGRLVGFIARHPRT
jgi:hypothetical protein